MKQKRIYPLVIAGLVLAAAAWKLVFLLKGVVPFNSDEAIVALMARHILQGERPVFFYGQAYMGSLDAFLVAGGFQLFGQHVWVIRLVQAMLYMGIVLTTILIGREAFGSFRTGLLAGLLLAVPTVNVTLYTTASLGGYGEALLLGSLSLLVAIILKRRWVEQDSVAFPWVGFLIWGVLAGFGLWANGLSLVFSAPSGLYLAWAFFYYRRKWFGRFFLLAGPGFLLGSMPWWLYAAANGPDRLIRELFGSAVAVEQTSWLARTGAHLVSFLLLGVSVTFGLRPPWNVQWLVLPVLPFVLIFWLGVVWFLFRAAWRTRRHEGIYGFTAEYALLCGVIVTLLAGFLFTAFGVDPSGRYFLPLAIPLALAAARAVQTFTRRGWQAIALVLMVVGYNLGGTIQSGLNFPPGLTTQFYEPTIIDHRADAVLIAFLRDQGETRGYSNYWVAYPLAFQSSEDLLFIPRLPYHLDMRYTPRDDRYAPYTQIVAQSSRVAYITTRNPALDETLRARFAQQGITWEEQKIGDYRVYYHLSRIVRPEDIRLGGLSP